jgi:hypothetical protein
MSPVSNLNKEWAGRFTTKFRECLPTLKTDQNFARCCFGTAYTLASSGISESGKPSSGS